jgi:2-succinyl-5-enolpyruvyl-6-hydroxy-3-cyclohexene-1-carboxylate synthase
VSDLDVTQAFAATFVDELVAGGLRHVCICPGSRSAPLAMAFARHPGIRCWVHLDERSGSFFALGLAKASGETVGVLSTSGTAAVELHAAVVEAFHSRTPLLVITADRPPELRDSGANQTIDQAGLFGPATRWSFDPGPPFDTGDDGRSWRRLAARALAEAGANPAGPVHLNLPFREPLVAAPRVVPAAQPAPNRPSLTVGPATAVPAQCDVDRLADALAAAERPMLVLGEMRDGAALARSIERIAAATGAVVAAEPLSQLRLPVVGVIANYEALLRDQDFATRARPDLVIRLGAQPSSKALAAHLETGGARHQVLVDSGGGWRDPAALATEVIRCDEETLLTALAEKVTAANPSQKGWQAEWMAADGAAADALEKALGGVGMFEAHAVRALARVMPERSTLLCGSSMAVRDVDWFWPHDATRRFLANRGASGIDGFVSTGLGAAAGTTDPVLVLCGDLTLYHDMNGLWAAGRHDLHPTFVVLNNDGGGIFSFLPQVEHPDVFEEVFGTPLGLDLARVAALYDLAYFRVDSVDELEPTLLAAQDEALQGPSAAMVDVRFSRSDSVAGHRAAWQAVAASVAG